MKDKMREKTHENPEESCLNQSFLQKEKEKEKLIEIREQDTR